MIVVQNFGQIMKFVSDMQKGVRSNSPVLAKLWYFWANHFTISDTQRFAIRFSTGAYQREFIRANMDKTFETMV